MRGLWVRLRRFCVERSGNMAIGTAVMAVPLMLGLGLAVDAGNQNRVRGELQAALDAAAMQIALNLNSGRTDEQLQALGSDFLKANIDAYYVDSGNVPSLK